jgi:hypothetical protein
VRKPEHHMFMMITTLSPRTPWQVCGLIYLLRIHLSTNPASRKNKTASRAVSCLHTMGQRPVPLLK